MCKTRLSISSDIQGFRDSIPAETEQDLKSKFDLPWRVELNVRDKFKSDAALTNLKFISTWTTLEGQFNVELQWQEGKKR